MPNDNKKSAEFLFEKKEDEAGNIKYIATNSLEKDLSLKGDALYIFREGIGKGIDVTLTLDRSQAIIKKSLGKKLVIDMDNGAQVKIESKKEEYNDDKHISFIYRDKNSKLAWPKLENSKKEKCEKYCKTSYRHLDSTNGYAVDEIIPKNTCLYLDNDEKLLETDKKTILFKGTEESVTIEKLDSEALNIKQKIGKNNHFICKKGMVIIDAKAIGDNLSVELYDNAEVFIDTEKKNIGQNVKFKCNSENNKVVFIDSSIDDEKYIIPYEPAQPSPAAPPPTSNLFQQFFAQPSDQGSFATGGAGVNQPTSAEGNVDSIQIGNVNEIHIGDNISVNYLTNLTTKPANTEFKISEALKKYQQRFSTSQTTGLPPLSLSKQIESLYLTGKEKKFFRDVLEKFKCSILMDDMHIPVVLNERRYDYVSLKQHLDRLKDNGQKLIDPYTRELVTFSEISPCRQVFKDFDKFKKKLDFYRQSVNNFPNYEHFEQAYVLSMQGATNLPSSRDQCISSEKPTSPFLKGYLREFKEGKETLSQSMTKLSLTDKEETSFQQKLEKLECPITYEYINIPVTLAENTYDYQNLMNHLDSQLQAQTLSDPNGNEIQYSDIQPNRRLFSKFEKIKEIILAERTKNSSPANEVTPQHRIKI